MQKTFKYTEKFNEFSNDSKHMENGCVLWQLMKNK